MTMIVKSGDDTAAMVGEGFIRLIWRLVVPFAFDPHVIILVVIMKNLMSFADMFGRPIQFYDIIASDGD